MPESSFPIHLQTSINARCIRGWSSSSTENAVPARNKSQIPLVEVIPRKGGSKQRRWPPWKSDRIIDPQKDSFRVIVVSDVSPCKNSRVLQTSTTKAAKRRARAISKITNTDFIGRSSKDRLAASPSTAHAFQKYFHLYHTTMIGVQNT